MTPSPLTAEPLRQARFGDAGDKQATDESQASGVAVPPSPDYSAHAHRQWPFQTRQELHVAYLVVEHTFHLPLGENPGR